MIQCFTFPFNQDNGIQTDSHSKVYTGCINKDHKFYALSIGMKMDLANTEAMTVKMDMLITIRATAFL